MCIYKSYNPIKVFANKQKKVEQIPNEACTKLKLSYFHSDHIIVGSWRRGSVQFADVYLLGDRRSRVRNLDVICVYKP